MYKELSSEIKRDIERCFCVRNTLRWINADLNGTFDKYFFLFTEEIGLDIDELMKNSEYLSTFTPEKIEEKFNRRAEIINMPAQEYVDTCSGHLIRRFVQFHSKFTIPDVIRFMNLDNVEKAEFNQSISSFMGNEWGRNVYSSGDEVCHFTTLFGKPVFFIVNRCTSQ